MRARREARDEGAVLVLALVLSGLLAALGMSVLMVADIERRAAANDAASAATLAAADAGVERAMAELRRLPEWSPLDGGTIAGFAGGGGQVALPAGGSWDLDRATVDLQAQWDSAGAAGPDAPIWRLVGWGSLEQFAAPEGAPRLEYLAIWMADNAGDGDGDPGVDRDACFLVHVEARGLGGTRRVVEGAVARPSAGIVQRLSWREVR